MPSNQYRPLTRPPPPRSILSIPNLVPRVNRILTTFSAIYIVISILSSLAPPSTNPRSGKSAECDPFALPGFISLLPSGLSSYRTFDPSCPVPGLLPTLLALLPSSPYHNVAVPSTHSHSRADLTSRIANKTVLLIGDQVDHALVEHFCTLIGHTAEVIDQRHPWGLAWTKVPDRHRKLANSNAVASGNPGNKALAHYCYMPDYDFLLTSTNHLGTDEGDTFHKTPDWTSPTLFEYRVEDLYIPYMKDLATAHPTAPSIPPPRSHAYPDLTILSSSFWDLARYAHEDSVMMRSLVDDLTEARLLNWRGRNVDMLLALRSAWKDTKLAWRSLHPPGDTETATVEWWTGEEKDGTNAINPHPLFHLNRISQLNAARRSALHPTGDDKIKGVRSRSARLPNDIIDFDLGTILLGEDHHQSHPINPSLDPGGSIFAEMLLNIL